MIAPMLREMREEMRAGLASVNSRLASVEAGIVKIEAAQKAFRSAMTHDTLMSKFLLGDFEERLANLEAQVERLSPTDS